MSLQPPEALGMSNSCFALALLGGQLQTSAGLPGWGWETSVQGLFVFFLTFFIFRTGFPRRALTVIISNLLGFVVVMGEHFMISEACGTAAVYGSDST